MTSLIAGIVQRALEFVLKEVLPNAASALPGPFGALLKVALGTDYAQSLEATVAGKLANLTSTELAKVEAECQAWASGFLAHHPEAQAFIKAIKPATVPQFVLKDDELAALLAAQADGTLRPKLGLS